jgi:hypothetical protein
VHAPSDRGSQIRIRLDGSVEVQSPAPRARRSLGKISAAALLPFAAGILAACSGGQSDNPALGQAPSTAAPGVTTQAAPGPQVSIGKVNGLPVPQLAGKATMNASLRQVAAGLSGTCSVAVERDDARLGSFLWTCGGQRTGVTYDQRTERKLALDDLFQGAYRPYLTSTAVSQMKADGVSSPSASDFSIWYVTPSSLVIAFPQSVVSFPLQSLAGYVRAGGPLAT